MKEGVMRTVTVYGVDYVKKTRVPEEYSSVD